MRLEQASAEHVGVHPTAEVGGEELGYGDSEFVPRQTGAEM